MGKITPSMRTQSWLGEQGYTCGTVERFIHPNSFVGAGHRRDLFGCIDIVAVRPREVLAVQSTGTDWSGHWKKLMEGSGQAGLLLWLSSGSPFLLIGWRKLQQGWQPRIHYFHESDVRDAISSRRERTYGEWLATRSTPSTPTF